MNTHTKKGGWVAHAPGYLENGLTVYYSLRVLDADCTLTVTPESLSRRYVFVWCHLSQKRFSVASFLILHWMNRNFDGQLFNFPDCFSPEDIELRLASAIDATQTTRDDENELFLKYPAFRDFVAQVTFLYSLLTDMDDVLPSALPN